MMSLDPAVVVLVAITLFAATVNGALGYGFSSLTVPVAVLFYANRVLNPALVLVELVVNTYSLFINRGGVPRVWRRTLPILIGLVPGVLLGSFALSTLNGSSIKLITYVVLLPLILVQAAGLRRYIQAEKAVGLPLGAGIGVLYSVTTISGPPLALMLNNQGFVRQDFRASLALVRIAESGLTAITYAVLGLYTLQTGSMIAIIAPSVIVGVPLGVFLIRRMLAETFRRMCMSFDAWVVGFGLSRTLMDLGIASDPAGYIVLALAGAIDLTLLARFFRKQRRGEAVLQPAIAAH
ncbi:MAG: sulfite exporter TauE/SafE family protein [Chloroflexi bacterium]|nr:sulfite exporter TauE/SafE family protein [Chloroflexota bacterium]MBV9896558.1 sulfite exporter TauE/SafE family protein [Chloroflexota bacterium]